MLLKHRAWTLLLVPFLLTAALFSNSTLASGDCIAIEFTIDGNIRCEEMHRTTDQAISEGWVVRRIDPKTDPHVATRWQIQNVPTTILVRNGREMDRILGPISYVELQKRLNAASSVDSIRNDRPINAPQLTAEPLVRGQSPLATVPFGALYDTQNDPRRSDSASQLTNNLGRVSQPANSSPKFNGRDPREATVRIRVSESRQEGVGTGTIIDSYDGEALVLTCGHLFRDSQGQASIVIETFVGGQVQTYQGTLIDFQADEMDIGLVSFRPTTDVSVATLIPKNRKLSEGQRVFSWGCDRGAPPSRNDSRITKLNRYLGAPNVEVDGQPVEGRSGGGLFDERGELIGVCYAADPSLKEGLYNSAEVVYHQLAKLGLQRLFNERKDEPENLVANNSTATAVAPRMAEQTRISEPSSAAQQSGVQEMTVVLRDRDGNQEQLRINQPSPQLLQALREQTRR